MICLWLDLTRLMQLSLCKRKIMMLSVIASLSTLSHLPYITPQVWTSHHWKQNLQIVTERMKNNWSSRRVEIMCVHELLALSVTYFSPSCSTASTHTLYSTYNANLGHSQKLHNEFAFFKTNRRLVRTPTCQFIRHSFNQTLTAFSAKLCYFLKSSTSLLSLITFFASNCLPVSLLCLYETIVP